MGREARCAERPGPGARRRGDPTPDPAGRTECPGQGRERGTGPLQPPRRRSPAPTQRGEAEETPPPRRTARGAATAMAAPRVALDDDLPRGLQRTRAAPPGPAPSIDG